MDRRSFLKTSALGGSAAAASTLAAPAYAQGNRTLTMVTTWGRGLAGVHDSAQFVADTITAMSDGTLTVDVKAAGELVGAFEVFDAVTAGQADMYHAADYYFVSQHPGYAYFTAVPFGMTPQELVNWYYHGDGHALHDELGQIFGLKSFIGGNTGPQGRRLVSTRKSTAPRTSTASSSGCRAWAARRWANWAPPCRTFRAPKCIRRCPPARLTALSGSAPGRTKRPVSRKSPRPTTPLASMSPARRCRLPPTATCSTGLSPAHQKIIEMASAAGHQWSLAQFMNNNGAALQRLQSGGVKTLEFPDSVWDAFGCSDQGNPGRVHGRRAVRKNPRQRRSVDESLLRLDHQIRRRLPRSARPRPRLICLTGINRILRACRGGSFSSCVTRGYRPATWAARLTRRSKDPRGKHAGREVENALGEIAGVQAVATGDINQEGRYELGIVSDQKLHLLTTTDDNQNGWIDVALLAARVEDKGGAGSQRINHYGYGSLIEVRNGIRFQQAFVDSPVTRFGLGDTSEADAVRIIWTNGIPQNIVKPESNQQVWEVQKLLGSCPYLYAWNGEVFEFVTDLLWAAPIGLQNSQGQLVPDRPWEYIKIAADQLQPKDGKYVLQITEELWEVAYFDKIELIAIDHPADIEIYSNEKVGPASIAEFKIHQVRDKKSPVSVVNHLGDDLLDDVRREDGVFARPFTKRITQGYTDESYLEIDLGLKEKPGQLTLYLTGWIRPTDTGLNVAFSENASVLGPAPPSISVPNETGEV